MRHMHKEPVSWGPVIYTVIIVIIFGSILRAVTPEADATPPSLEAFCSELGPNAAETYCP